jgi:dephospho-CoA kinase
MVVGLTGGIGSGKSTVSKVFELLGCLIFDSDKAAKDIYFEADAKLRIIALLGEESYLSDTEINKSYISTIIFNNTQLLHALNSIIHPIVAAKFSSLKKNHPYKLIVKESALLFEADLTAQVDKIITVASDDDLRIKRVMNRDGLSKENVMAKIKSQLPQEEKIKKSDFVIYNNETEFVITQVLAIYTQLNDA